MREINRGRSNALGSLELAQSLKRPESQGDDAKLLYSSKGKSPGIVQSLVASFRHFISHRAAARGGIERSVPDGLALRPESPSPARAGPQPTDTARTRHPDPVSKRAAATTNPQHHASASVAPQHQGVDSARTGSQPSETPGADLSRLKHTEVIHRFKQRFGDSVPGWTEVMQFRTSDPEAYRLCLQLVENDKVVVAFRFMDALLDLKADPTIDKARQLIADFVQDPNDQGLYGLTSYEKLNLYEKTYDSFLAAFARAESALLSASDPESLEEAQKQLLAAFDKGVYPIALQDCRDFRNNARAELNNHAAAAQAVSASRPDPGRFA